MRVSKKSSKRVLSFIMALAVALTMCIGFMPQKVLAATTWFVHENGNVDNNSANTIIYVYANDDVNVSEVLNYNNTNKELTITGGTFTGFSPDMNGLTYVIAGTCTIDELYIHEKTKIVMKDGAKLTVGKIVVEGSTLSPTGEISLSDAYAKSFIEIEGGTISGDAIVSDGSGTNTGENTGTDIKVGDTVTPKDGSSKDSATYKVTGTDEGKRSVTYEKPAENASGTEEIKASVILKDGNEYKVTAIGDGAFKNFEKKDDIAKIIIGDNVEQIGKSACEDLKNVKEIKIGKNVKKIGAKAFKGCVALTKCDVPDNVEEIGESANEGCKKLTKLTIGKKVKKIGKKAYYQSGLKNIKVKSSKLTKASKIGKNAFGKINKKAKVKMKMTKSEAKKAKAPTIKVFKNKKIGYVKTWSVS